MRLLSLPLILLGSLAHAQPSTVMSYNIRYATDADSLDAWELRKADVAGLLRYYRPAAAGLQEALHAQIEYLDDALPDYRYVGIARTDGRQEGEYAPILYDTAAPTAAGPPTTCPCSRSWSERARPAAKQSPRAPGRGQQTPAQPGASAAAAKP